MARSSQSPFFFLGAQDDSVSQTLFLPLDQGSPAALWPTEDVEVMQATSGPGHDPPSDCPCPSSSLAMRSCTGDEVAEPRSPSLWFGAALNPNHEADLHPGVVLGPSQSFPLSAPLVPDGPSSQGQDSSWPGEQGQAPESRAADSHLYPLGGAKQRTPGHLLSF